jgi:pilus assembly protein CpaC
MANLGLTIARRIWTERKIALFVSLFVLCCGAAAMAVLPHEVILAQAVPLSAKVADAAQTVSPGGKVEDVAQTVPLNARVEDVTPSAGEPVELVLGHGRLLHLDEPVEAVFLGDPSIADVNVVAPDYIYVIGKKLGATNLIAIAMDGADREANKGYVPGTQSPAAQAVKASLRISVIADTRPANEAAQKAAPRSVTQIEMFGRRVVATGKTHTPEEAKALQDAAQSFSPAGQPPINNTTIEGSQQVNIRVRFAEVSRTDLQTLGINWQVFNLGEIAAAVIGLHHGRHNADINELIDALQRNGVLNVLAEPNLTTVTGQEASFLAGGEVPVPVPQGRDSVTMMYKQFGVSLVFTPTLIRKNRIALHIKPEVSMISNVGAIVSAGNKMPSFIVRRADTTVEVASGQTFAIGGLFQRSMAHYDDEADRAPILGDLPVIGPLFHSPRFRRNETELVILITPYLVNPVSGRDLALPTDRPGPYEAPLPQEPPVVAARDKPKPSLGAKNEVKKPSPGLIIK